MSNVIEDVRAYIITLGAPWSSANVFCADFPDAPDTACCVFEYPAELEHFLGGGSSPIETARFQVVVRDPGYATARQYANSLPLWTAHRFFPCSEKACLPLVYLDLQAS